MRVKSLSILFLMLMCVLVPVANGQRIITYESGMGSRDRDNADVWILYQEVKAMHDGMTLFADSATFDTKNNIFTAYRNVVILISDTTTLYGEEAIYDGTTRIADVWGDTVTLVDGRTVLQTDLLSYDRNTSTASYFHWGYTVHDSASTYSDKGYYHSDTRDLFLYDNVRLEDSTSWLETDTLHYNTRTCEAQFVSPTLIYSDSSTIYSELGSYNTDSHQAQSFKATRLTNRAKWLTADTLYFNDNSEHGEAMGHVVVVDTANDVICRGGYGITDQQERYTFVTDSAQIIFIDEGDSLFMHADSLWAYNNDEEEFESARAFHNVRMYRYDAQAVCDSLYYNAADSLVSLYYDPVVWYEDYQCVADTVHCLFDSSGVRLIHLRGNVLASERVDAEKFNQVKGRNADVYCKESEPLYADILGSARMVYYVLDEEPSGERSLLGVNVGMGSDMRIYFKDRKPRRFSTYGSPDMKMYPPGQLPATERELPGFRWRDDIRPHSPTEIFLRTKGL